MARLHVIWDRDGMVEHKLGDISKDKLKVAMIDLKDDATLEETGAMTEMLADLLLKQFADAT